eukprot:1744079-Lingulodinium_polyedra.AAC.1
MSAASRPWPCSPCRIAFVTVYVAYTSKATRASADPGHTWAGRSPTNRKSAKACGGPRSRNR